jgi:two-component system, cell cycle response regulator
MTIAPATTEVKKPRILLVDDSKIVRVTISRILSTKFDLVIAENGEEAWQKICDDDSIQVVFTDLGMPLLDGYGLIQRIRQSENERIRHQPVIVITGAAEEENVKKRVFELGATDFITKPFNSTEILARAEAHASYRRDKEVLQKNVDIDLLTGTLNHNGLKKQLDKDVSFINRHGENMAVVLFKLDEFKTLHDRVGDKICNGIIKQTANSLLNAIRKEDSVGRFGMDKFLVILPMAKTEGVIMLAKRLCERIKTLKVKVGEEIVPVSISAGIAIVRKGSPTHVNVLIECAEQALINANKLGLGEVQLLKLEDSKAEEKTPLLSIDNLLDAINKNTIEITEHQMNGILKRLSPLIALMTDKQKSRLFKTDRSTE